MKKIIWIVGILLTGVTCFGQGISQDWYGILSMPDGKALHLVFHITKAGENYTTTLDSPDQGARGLESGKTKVNGNLLTIEAAKYGIQYIGTYLPDSNLIKGVFKQGGGEIPLTLTATKAAERITPPIVRPQDPKDFPYKQEDVVFTNSKGRNQLAGTITMPSDGKARRIVILISGSGAQNRNEELIGHRPFLVWSDWLTRHGIAVLRYDDRGTGQSTGNFKGATTADFADDTEAAVNYIKSRPDLKKMEIGLVGHSEGGAIAPIVASRNPSVKFIVLLAGPGVSTEKLMAKQTEDLARAGGTPEDAIRLSVATNRKLYTLIVQNPGLSTENLKQKVDTLLHTELRNYPTSYLGGKAISDIVSNAETMAIDPWFRYFLAFNPDNYLQKTKCPVLALNGAKDMQVNAEANLAGIKSSLEKGGNKHFEIVPLEGLNHLFQKAGSGAFAEYGQIQETVNPAAMEKVSAWIDQL